MNYTRETATSLLCSSFKCGYQQFETWNNNGLYDIFGDRKYRTPLNHLQNEIDKTCKWMASDYAIEFTRRQFGLTTSDSRYDDATFIICLTQNIEQPVAFICNAMVFEAPVFNQFSGLGNGDTITVSAIGSAGPLTLIVAGIHSFGFYVIVLLSGTAPPNLYAGACTIDFSFSGAPTVINGRTMLIDNNGAAMLLNTPLFNANSSDVIQFDNTLYNGAMHVISNIIEPNGFFPQFIFSTTAFVNELNPQCTVFNFTQTQYVVEQGMQNGTNVLSRDTVMNYRISPAHAAMRHYRNIITDRQYASQHLIFTGGTGNFYALGTLTGSCAPEGHNLSEGSYLSLNNFAVHDDGKPLFYPEIIKFEYPLTWAQFLAIQQSPYGLIQYEHANDGVQQGWITDLQYHPYTGLAEFTLYPKI